MCVLSLNVSFAYLGPSYVAWSTFTLENDRGNPRVEKGLPLPLPPQNPYPRRG
jgi:hypothetical protein